MTDDSQRPPDSPSASEPYPTKPSTTAANPIPDDPPPPYRDAHPSTSLDGDENEHAPLLGHEATSSSRRVEEFERGSEGEVGEHLEAGRQRRSRASFKRYIAHTAGSLFRPDTTDEGPSNVGYIHLPPTPSPDALPNGSRPYTWRAYVQPLTQPSSYVALFHLSILNFPWALGVWLVLFILALLGATLLVILPIGVALCFGTLLLARVFARAELVMQATFYPAAMATHLQRTGAARLRYPPIFTRANDVEGVPLLAVDEGAQIETRQGFWKNTVTMFKSPTSYTCLLYFLILKPLLTLLPFLLLFPLSIVALCVPVLGWVLSPSVLRIARRIGMWQAGVALHVLL